MYINKTLKKIYQVILFSNKRDVKYDTNINKKNWQVLYSMLRKSSQLYGPIKRVDELAGIPSD